jgi:hypothetical protein
MILAFVVATALSIRAKDLPDALEKLASGAIPIEALRITAEVREVPGWLLELRGREITVRQFEKGRLRAARTRRLDSEELRTLVKLLRDAAPATFPKNLYAPTYAHFRVQVLNRSQDVQARPYEGVTPSTHGVRQLAFDRVLDYLQRLALPQPLR